MSFEQDLVFDSPVENVIEVWETPSTISSLSFKFPFLTRISKLGKTQVWEIGFDGKDIFTNFGTIHADGTQDKFRIERKEVIPKSNRSLVQQALQEMRQSRKLKIDKGYLPLVTDQPRLIVPMKGYPYDPKRIKHYPLYGQIKIDGIRYLVYKNGSVLQFKSSSNSDVKTLGHLNDEITLFSSLLPSVCTIDGEIYNHSMKFEDITAAFKKTKKETLALEYWIFDLDYQSSTSTVYYQDRYKLLTEVYSIFEDLWYEMYMDPPQIKVVPCQVLNSTTEIEELFVEYSKEYEGLMVKKIFCEGMDEKERTEALYNRQTRTYGVMKLKKQQDCEFKVVGYSEANGTQKGCIIFELETEDGKRFKAAPEWKLAKKREAFENGDSYIGKMATCVYQNLTKYGIPRHPRVKEIRDYE